MKIIEAMKELKLITKKMEKNASNITQYSSLVSTERPVFGSEADQRKEVASLIQSNKDLMSLYLDLKIRIDRTNMETEVTMSNGKVYSISELLVMKRSMCNVMIHTYAALKTDLADMRLAKTAPHSGDKEHRPQVIRLYDEKEKNEKLDEWMTLKSEIDGRLEVVNAVTDLV